MPQPHRGGENEVRSFPFIERRRAPRDLRLPELLPPSHPEQSTDPVREEVVTFAMCLGGGSGLALLVVAITLFIRAFAP